MKLTEDQAESLLIEFDIADPSHYPDRKSPTEQRIIDVAGDGDLICWFIERPESVAFGYGKSNGRWLFGFDQAEPIWTDNPLIAVWFCRKEDAEKLTTQFGLFSGIGKAGQNVFVSEHKFVSSDVTF